MKSVIFAVLVILSVAAKCSTAAAITQKPATGASHGGEYVPDDMGVYHTDDRGTYAKVGDEGMYHADGKGLYSADESGLYHDTPTLWRYQKDARGVYMESPENLKKH